MKKNSRVDTGLGPYFLRSLFKFQLNKQGKKNQIHMLIIYSFQAISYVLSVKSQAYFDISMVVYAAD